MALKLRATWTLFAKTLNTFLQFLSIGGLWYFGLMVASILLSSLTVVANAVSSIQPFNKSNYDIVRNVRAAQTEIICPPDKYPHFGECRDCSLVCGPQYGNNQSECQKECPDYELNNLSSTTPSTTTSALSSTLSTDSSSIVPSVSSLMSENVWVIILVVVVFTLLPLVVMIFLKVFKPSLLVNIEHCCNRLNDSVQETDIQPDGKSTEMEMWGVLTRHPKPNNSSPISGTERSQLKHLVSEA